MSPDISASSESQPQAQKPALVASVPHTVGFLIICAVVAVYEAHRGANAAHMHFSSRVPMYILSICLEVGLFAYVWLLGLRPRGYSVAEIVGGRWTRWTQVIRDIGVAFVFWVVVLGVLFVVQLALRGKGLGGIQWVFPQSPTEVVLWVTLSITAGFCEEFIYRGYLQKQILALTGSLPAAVVLQGAIFGVQHIYQGAKSMVVIMVYGMLFGVLAVVRNSLRPGMMQHAAQDSLLGVVEFLSHR
jgi:uncharacterized protein